MPFKYIILATLLTLSSQVYNQSTVEVRGKVVEVTEGKPVGLPEIKVTAVGQDYDVTDVDGNFSLDLSPEREFATIILENCPHPMISPFRGQVPIPPSGFLTVQVCAKANEKLRNKVEALNKKLIEVERQHRLTKRHMADMQAKMLNKIIGLEAEVEILEKELIASGQSLDEANRKIAEMEKKNEELEGKLLAALEEKYLRQKKVYDEITASLEQYIDQSKNLRDNMLPERVGHYFSVNAGARERLYESIEKYNKARQRILDNHKVYVASVSNYWDAMELAGELESLYDYLLDDVHQQGVYPMDFSVTDNLRAFLNRATTSNKARKAAEQGAAAAIPNLNPKITTLEKRSDEILYKLKNNL